MALSEIDVARVRLNNAREKAKVLGADARRAAMVYLAARKRWLESLDVIDVRDRELDEKVAIELAYKERKRRNRGEEERGKDPDETGGII
jgi:hypothetical protein